MSALGCGEVSGLGRRCRSLSEKEEDVSVGADKRLRVSLFTECRGGECTYWPCKRFKGTSEMALAIATRR